MEPSHGGHPLFTDVDVSSSLNMIHEEGTKYVLFHLKCLHMLLLPI